MREFKTVNLREIDKICEESLKAGKYIVIVDTTARANVFFEYKAT